MVKIDVVKKLAAFRKEWEQAAAGEPLVDVQVSFGLMLLDVAEALDLAPHEAERVLGPELILLYGSAIGEAEDIALILEGA